MPASFNGADLGFIFDMTVGAMPPSLQQNVYPGANGIEVLFMGSRGGRTTVQGATVADNAADLAVAEQAIRTLQVSGQPYTLVDTTGTSWTNVIMLTFQPEGRILPTAGGGVARKYSAEFLHIS